MNSTETNNHADDDAPIDKDKLLKKMALQIEAMDTLDKVRELFDSDQDEEASALLAAARPALDALDDYDLSEPKPKNETC